MIIETKTKKLTKNHPAVNALIRCSLFSHLNVLEYYIFVNSVMDLLMQADLMTMVTKYEIVFL